MSARGTTTAGVFTIIGKKKDKFLWYPYIWYMATNVYVSHSTIQSISSCCATAWNVRGLSCVYPTTFNLCSFATAVLQEILVMDCAVTEYIILHLCISRSYLLCQMAGTNIHILSNPLLNTYITPVLAVKDVIIIFHLFFQSRVELVCPSVWIYYIQTVQTWTRSPKRLQGRSRDK